MNIKAINRRHLMKVDKQYRRRFGLFSELICFRNGIMYIEVNYGTKWRKKINTTAFEIACAWKENNIELKHAIGAKVFFIDANGSGKTGSKARRRPNVINGRKIKFDYKRGLLFSGKYLN